MLAWAASFAGGIAGLGGYALYVCRGRRTTRRLTAQQAREIQVLTALEQHEDLL
jgi:hypothetical protein